MDKILHSLITEQPNKRSENIDVMDTLDVLRIINDEDKKVAFEVEKKLDKIAEAIDGIVDKLKRKGRLLYFGAGTSGRLGILDAAECPPTFGTEADMVQGIIAGGGFGAMNVALEGIEDHEDYGAMDVEQINVSCKDAVVGLTASGRTPYVIGALKECKKRGAFTVAVCCNESTPLDSIVDVSIKVPVGPEVILGSTRLKAGTAQKMILNMISSVSMIKLGKVYKNLMVDLKPKNYKLIDRAKRIISLATGVDYKEAERYFELSKRNPKVAIVMIETGAGYDTAYRLLKKANGFVSRAIEMYTKDRK